MIFALAAAPRGVDAFRHRVTKIIFEFGKGELLRNCGCVLERSFFLRLCAAFACHRQNEVVVSKHGCAERDWGGRERDSGGRKRDSGGR